MGMEEGDGCVLKPVPRLVRQSESLLSGVPRFPANAPIPNAVAFRLHVLLGGEGRMPTLLVTLALGIRDEPALGDRGRHEGRVNDDGDEQRKLRPGDVNRPLANYRAALRARLGATRGGSSGCFG
jgi:hypothetical protein